MSDMDDLGTLDETLSIGGSEQYREQGCQSMPSAEALAACLWQHLHDSLDKYLATYIQKAVREAFAEQMSEQAQHDAMDDVRSHRRVPHRSEHHACKNQSDPCLIATDSITKCATRSQSMPTRASCTDANILKGVPTWPWTEKSMTMKMVESMNLEEIIKNDMLDKSIVGDATLGLDTCSEDGLGPEFNGPSSLMCCASNRPFTKQEHRLLPIIPGWVSHTEQTCESRKPPTLTSVDSVRKASERHILASTSCSMSESEESDRAVKVSQDTYQGVTVSQKLRWYWAVWGILAWSRGKHAARYRNVMLCISLCCTAVCMFNLIQQPSRIFENFAETAFAISGLVSLLCSRQLDNLLGPQDPLLARYAARSHFLKMWNRRGTVTLMLFNAVWVCKTVTHLISTYAAIYDNPVYTICTAFVVPFVAGSYLALMHSAFHVTSFLQLILDQWTVDFNKDHDCTRGAEAWNSLQALMRRVAEAIQTCFLAVQTSALIAFICCAARVLAIIMTKPGNEMRAAWSSALLELPTLVMAACALMWFAKASGVTEQSVRVPPVVNSLLVEPRASITPEHHVFVSFVKNSDAGFYVAGSQLNATVFMNYCYLCGAVICGLFSAALNVNQK